MRRLGLEMILLKAGTESEIESVVVAAVQQQAKALTVAADAYLSSRSRQIAFFALRHALATMSDARENAAAGLLMSYGPNQADSFRQIGLYISRILKGEKPADLPVLHDQVRAGHQSHDRQGNRAENPGILPPARQ